VKLLIIGSGGREHALVWKLKQSPLVEQIWCAPGNGGISRDAQCFPLDLNDVSAAAHLAERLGADLTIVGPELPLVLGIGDEFARRGLSLLGPTRQGAQLEGSKVFAKEFMERHSIPTAGVYGVFHSAIDAYAELCTVEWPLVLKADGLCAGKGVLVTSSPDEATAFIDRAIERCEFGDAGKTVLLEEGLQGQELSYIILTDGKNFVPMAPTKDYKRLRDNDEGPNTGGMGAYSSDDILSAESEQRILETVVRPTLTGLRAEGIDYKGFLYFGLMLTADGPKVLEFNCRLGDPEAEVIVLRANFDFAEACSAAAQERLRDFRVSWRPSFAACVVVAAPGYPEKPTRGLPIRGLDSQIGPDLQLFHAGTEFGAGNYYTCGGRVVMVCGRGEDIRGTRGLIYDVVSTIKLADAQVRRDIAFIARDQKAATS
jgi:phosphoribosylamine---glycine ligase